MAYTTIDDPSAYFTTLLYTGNATDDRNLTNSANAGDFKPDILWLKERSSTSSHQLHDSTRGSSFAVLTDQDNAAEDEDGNRVQAFQTNGFQIGTASTVNQDTITMVAWQWKCNGGTTTNNDASSTGIGTHDSVIQANTTAGLSIVTWTGNAEPETLAHGLGGTPEMIIIKNRPTTEGFWVGASAAGSIAGGKNLTLGNTNAVATNSTSFVNQDPTSTVFRVGGSNSAADAKVNGNGHAMLAYCFRSIQGYSKIGSYIGNGSTNGTFIYTGFKPGWLMVKGISANSREWFLFDGTRDTFNPFAKYVKAESTDAEASSAFGDFCSNGFKVRSDGASYNASGQTFVYMAFAEHPFVSSEGVPTTAR